MDRRTIRTRCPKKTDEVPRGAYFLFISAKAMATIEFLQQEWINDGNFIGAGNERDPIIGLQDDGATFTIPKEPVRRRVHGIETFNVLRGGEYFFMPSLSALRWLSELGWQIGPVRALWRELHMSTIHMHQTTTSTPEQFLAALIDFGPGRSKLFGNSADEYLKVHHRGPSDADVTEGSGGIWERLHYDWSDPNRVVMTDYRLQHLGRPLGSHLHFHAAARRNDRRGRRRRPRGQEPQRAGARVRARDCRQGRFEDGI